MDSSGVRVEYGEPLGMESLPIGPPHPHPQPAQQQTSVVMVNAPTADPPLLLIQSFCWHIVLACCTFWCCGAAFGLAAFILAVKAQNLSTSPSVSDRVAARNLGKTSLWVSAAGILIGIVTIIIIVAVSLTVGSRLCTYQVDGKCFAFREKMSRVRCQGKGYHYDYATGYCYHF